MSQLAGSDHKPIKISLDINYKPNNAKTFPRWNFKKANWELFSTLTDSHVVKIRNKQQNLNQKVKALNKAILKAAAESIPRGCRKKTINLTGRRSTKSKKIMLLRLKKGWKKTPR